MRNPRLRLLPGAVIVVLLMAATPALALSQLPEQPPPSISTSSAEPISLALPEDAAASGSLEAALAQALELEDRIERDRDDAHALDQRIEVTNLQLFRQQGVLAASEAELSSARIAYEDRAVELYKGNALDPLLLLLSSRSLDEFTHRAQLFLAYLRESSDRIVEARAAAAEAAHEETVLEDAKSQLVVLRRIRAERTKDLDEALSQQRSIVKALDAQGAQAVTRRKDERTLGFKEWRKRSIPVGTPIEFVSAAVSPHTEPFLVAEYQPRTYHVVGGPYRAVCSWYGDEFNGRGTASGQLFNEEDLTCASKTLPFGTRLALERAGRRVVVTVTDRGPFIAGRDLDLSKSAAQALGFSGVEPVTVEFVEAP